MDAPDTASLETSHQPDAWLDVWACDHLWDAYRSGDAAASTRIATAAFDLMLDSGENVALCDDCAFAPTHVPMSLRQIQFGYPHNIDELEKSAPYKDHMIVFREREPLATHTGG